jgi:hypothetical protein
MLALSELNMFTDPPAFISISWPVAETLDPAYSDARRAANRLIACALSDRSSATSTLAESTLDTTDPPDDMDTGPLESRDALAVKADATPPTKAPTSSETEMDIKDVVTAAEKDSMPIAPPETPTSFAPTSIDCRVPTVTEDEATDRLSPDDSSTEPVLDN